MDNLAKPKKPCAVFSERGRDRCVCGRRGLAVSFFAMEHGIDYLWTEIPHMLGVASPELASVRSVFCRTRFSSACWAAC